MTWLLSKLAGLLPFQYYIAAAAALALTGWGASAEWRLHTAQAGKAQAEATLERERDAYAKAAFAATTANRVEEQRRAAAQQKVADETTRLLAKARADGASAVVSHGRLSDRADSVARGCSASSDPGTPIGSATASGAGLLLADVLRKSDERSGQLASYADQARIAGHACEAAYDALK